MIRVNDISGEFAKYRADDEVLSTVNTTILTDTSISCLKLPLKMEFGII